MVKKRKAFKKMTLLVTWTGIDSRGPASVYLAADSRVSWGGCGQFDHAIKTFATTQFPAIIGYCGDSLASLMLISQAIAVIDSMHHYNKIRLESFVDILVRLIVRNYSTYPIKLSAGSFTVIVCGKKKINSVGEFECYKITSTFDNFVKEQLQLPKKSEPIDISGSGTNQFKKNYEKHQDEKNNNKSTSRDVFHAFYETISAGKNIEVGVIPQITRVIRKPNTNGTHCGIVINSQRYIAGQLVDRDIYPDNIQWFNENFEITNPHTKQRALGAQPQPPFLC